MEQKYFPTQRQEEKIFLLIRKHWYNYVMFFFVTLITFLPVVGVLSYIYINSIVISPEIMNIIVICFSAFLLLVMAVELFGFVDYYLDIYIVTDQRLVDISQMGLFKRQISELQMRQVVDVSANVEGFFNTVLHFGDVHIQTAGERENFIFQSIPHPYTVAKQIVDLHQKEVETEKKKPGIAGSSGEYNEQSLERGFLTEQVESQAKKLISDRSLAHKPRHGFYVPKTNTALSRELTKKRKSKKANLIDLEGELKEGKETKIN